MTYEITKSEAPLSLDTPGIEAKTLAPVISAVIAQEGPIHREEITRRIGSFAGKHRVSPRLAAGVTQALNLLSEVARLLPRGGLLVDAGTQPGANRARPIGGAREPAKARDDRPLRDQAAIALARRQNGGVREDELPGAVASLLGLQKPTAGLRTAGGVNGGFARSAPRDYPGGRQPIPISDARTAPSRGVCGSLPRIDRSLLLSSRNGTCQR